MEPNAPRKKIQFSQKPKQFKITSEENSWRFSVGSPIDSIFLNRSQDERFTTNKTQLLSAINNRDRASLISYSNKFYHASLTYRRLVDYFANLLTFSYLIAPNAEGVAADVEKLGIDYLSTIDIIGLHRTITTSVIRDGLWGGVEREVGDSIIFQTLPPTHCHITSSFEGGYALSFDFSYFDQWQGEERDKYLAQFPPEFTSQYSAYEADKQNMIIQPLDPETSRAHMIGDNDIPMLANILVDILEVEELKGFDRVNINQKLSKILVQKPPLNKETNKPAIPHKEITTLHQNLRTLAKASHMDTVTTPCDINAIDVSPGYQGQNSASWQTQGLSSLYAGAGVPSLLFMGDKLSGMSLLVSIGVDASSIIPLLNQFEIWWNYRFKNLNHNCQIICLPTTHVNFREVSESYMELAAKGYPTKLLALAAMGQSPKAVKGLAALEETIEWGNNSGGKTSDYDPSNPRAKKGVVSDEGEKTRDGEKNEG